MYALAELGSLEYSGLITGKVNYESCFNYYLKAAKKNHPKASWMVANLIYYKRYLDIPQSLLMNTLIKPSNQEALPLLTPQETFTIMALLQITKKTLIKPQSATIKQQNQVMYMPIIILVDTTKTSMKKNP